MLAQASHKKRQEGKGVPKFDTATVSRGTCLLVVKLIAAVIPAACAASSMAGRAKCLPHASLCACSIQQYAHSPAHLPGSSL